MNSISLCISTCGDRIVQLSNWTFDERLNYLVLWQRCGSVLNEPIFPSNVQLINSESIGVTITRNIALEQCSTKWLWFMDDDVYIPKESIDRLLKLLPIHEDTDVLVTAVNFGVTKKSRTFVGSTSSIFSVFSVGTIQIICCPMIARKCGCFFPTNMGAGSQYPVCDEPVFLSRMLKNARVRLCGIPEVTVTHPPLSSGMDLHSPGHLISRAMFFREAFGLPLCIFLSTIFVIKHLAKIGWNYRYLFYYVRPS